VPVDRCKCANIHPKPTRDRRSNRIRIQPLTFDLAGLEHVFGERGQTCLIAQRQTDIGKPAEQQTLGATDRGQWRRDHRQIVAPGRPVRIFPDKSPFSAFHAVIMRCIRRKG